MSITIQCEMSDVTEFLRERENQFRILGEMRAIQNTLEQKICDLQDELRITQTSLENATKPDPVPVSLFAVRQLIIAITDGNKIGAIKEVRSMAKLGLKDSKNLVEEAMRCCPECKAVPDSAHFEHCVFTGKVSRDGNHFVSHEPAKRG